MKVKIWVPETKIPERAVTVEVQNPIELYQNARALVRGLQKEYFEAGEHLPLHIQCGDFETKEELHTSFHRRSMTISKRLIGKLVKRFPEVTIEVKFGNPAYKALYYYSIGYESKVTGITDTKLRAARLATDEGLTEKGTELFNEARQQGPGRGTDRSVHIMHKLLLFGNTYQKLDPLSDEAFEESHFKVSEELECFPGEVRQSDKDGYIGDWLYSLGLMDKHESSHWFVCNDRSCKWIRDHKEIAADLWLSERQETALIDCLPMEDLPRYLSSENELFRAVAKLRMDTLSGNSLLISG